MRKEQSILKIDVEEDIFEYDIVFPSNSFKDSDKHLYGNRKENMTKTIK